MRKERNTGKKRSGLGKKCLNTLRKIKMNQFPKYIDHGDRTFQYMAELMHQDRLVRICAADLFDLDFLRLCVMGL